MAVNPKTYDAGGVFATYGGALLEGYAEGEFLSYEQENDSISAAQGPDGEVALTIRQNTLGTLTVRLMQTSAANASLSTMLHLQAQPGYTFPACEVYNVNGGESVTASKAWLMGPPATVFGDESGVREWKIQGPFVVLNKGA
jgi:hypothetical protein